MLKRGFTLIELLTVISIIGLLASIVFTSLSSAKDKARIAAGKEFESNIYHSIGGTQLMGMWLFDEAANATNVVDGSDNGIADGTISGTVDREPGVEGTALNFDGTTNIDVPNKSFDGQPTMTWSMWYDATALVANAYLIDKAASAPFAWRVGVSNGKPNIAIQTTNNGWFSAGGGVTLGTKAYSLNQWHQLVFVYDGTLISEYVDGAPVDKTTVAISGSIVHSGADLHIGYESASGFYTGLLDDVRIYSSALTAMDIKHLYLAEAPMHRYAFK